MKIKSLILTILMFIPIYASAQIAADVYKKKNFIVNGETMPYRILYPENFSSEGEYPLILFLHGAGERGNNNEDQLIHVTQLLNPENLKEHPAVVLFPQCPKNDYWSNVEINREGEPRFIFKTNSEPTSAMKMAMNLLDSVAAMPYIDKDQIYVGGLSMGGMGTFEIVSRKPEMFAAAFPICGGANPKSVNTYAENTDFWIFHGGMDQVVNPKFSKIMAKAINQAGGNAKLTIYPKATHNSWDSAFAEPKLLDWIFSKELE
ncbi:MAG TPA: dienelactone hydrolase family protein [Salinimicrobium sp.]|nr:dienelactone hydrolase family protein [Salinimicrobium sp.]